MIRSTALCHSIAKRCLQQVGVRPDVAEASADQLIEAERRGYPSHGLQRLRLLVTAVERGVANGDPAPTVVRNRPGAALIDADRGLGAFIGRMAMEEACRSAQSNGSAVVGVRGAHYSGHLGYFTRPVAMAGCVALMTSTTPPMVHAHGGREPVLGTTPLSIAFPAIPHPVVLDLATSAGSRGRIMAAARRDEPLPDGWAIDADGRPTTDASAALDGALSPFGGHKGSGIAIMLTLLSSALVGMKPPPVEGPDVFATGTVLRGDLILVIDPDALAGRTTSSRMATAFGELVRDGAAADGSDGARMPGDRSGNRGEPTDGSLTIDPDLHAEIQSIVEGLGLDPAPWVDGSSP